MAVVHSVLRFVVCSEWLSPLMQDVYLCMSPGLRAGLGVLGTVFIVAGAAHFQLELVAR